VSNPLYGEKSVQVTVLSGFTVENGFDAFLSENTDRPIVLISGEEGKEISVKEGQFIKLSDGGFDISFEMLESYEQNNPLADELANTYGLKFLGYVPNDVTGKWRLAEYTSDSSPESFALDYYKAYFKGDDEIHALINRNQGITAKIGEVFDEVVVTIYQYHQDEEKDAKILFDGTPLAEYYINIGTGAIEKID